MEKTKIFVAAIVSALLFSSIVGAVGTTPALGEGAYTKPTTISINELVLETGTTDAFDGGDYVRIRLRDIGFWVLYGNETNLNWITMFTEYTRYFGRAEVYDNQGYFLAKRGIPLFTMLGQQFKFMFEFNDTDGNEVFNFRRNMGDNDTNINATDTVYKILSLKRTWNMTELTNTTLDNDTARIDFKLTATNLLYNGVNDTGGYRLRDFRPGNENDGKLEKIELYFHITIKIQNCFVPDVPWYNVTVDAGNHNAVTHSEWLRNENYTGKEVNCSFKYDHHIQGWDFVSNNSKLALETVVLAGDATPRKVNMWLRHQFGHCKGKYDTENGTQDNNGTEPEKPQKLTRDYIEFNDDWCRTGRLVWESNVSVDGVNETMLFQVHGGKRVNWTHAGNTFDGFWLFGAFIYPSGDNISHDPELVSTIPVFDIGKEEAQEKINDRDVRASYTAADIVAITPLATAHPQIPAKKKDIGIFVNVSTEGAVDEVFITIKYTAVDVASIDTAKLKMYYWTGAEWESVPDSGVWTNNNTVWAKVEHLTIFAPMAEEVASAPSGLAISTYIGILAIVLLAVIVILATALKRKKIA